MRFKVHILRDQRHREAVTCAGWISSDVIITCGDDHQLIAWNAITHEPNKLADLPQDLYPTDLHCSSKSVTTGGGKSSSVTKQVAADALVIGSSDGRLHLVKTSNGRIEKSVEAHQGSVLCCRWSNDGSAMASSGEDGLVKIWSKACLLRSTLSQCQSPVYSLSWSAQSDQIVFTVGMNLMVKPLAPNSKPNQWRAHDGNILKVSWSSASNLILTGGEDCRYKIWDSNGRLLFMSAAHDYPITSVAWNPDGTLFAVGWFNSLKLCDSQGWCHSLDKLPTSIGSLWALSWSVDGMQIVSGTSSGNVIVGHVVDHLISWKAVDVKLIARKVIAINNVMTNLREEVDFRENVIKLSMAFGHLIVITVSECQIFKVTNFHTPSIFHLKDQTINLIVQSSKHFILVDSQNVGLYSYDGRSLAAFKWVGMRVDLITRSTMSLASDTLAVRDASDLKMIHFLDTQSGKEFNPGGEQMKHKLDIVSLCLNQVGAQNDRLCAFIDKNADLYLMTVSRSSASLTLGLRTIKLTNMVKSMTWNHDANLLVTVAESSGRLAVYTLPSVAFIDRDLLSMAQIIKDSTEFGTKNPQLINFLESQITIRKPDGSTLVTAINPFGILLHSYVNDQRWNEALALCRFLKDTVDAQALWSTLAGAAILSRNVAVAEMAYSAVDKLDKVLYIQRINSIKNKEARNGEIALICGNIKEAENHFIQHGFILRAILLNLELFKWEKALELAIKYDSESPPSSAQAKSTTTKGKGKETKASKTTKGGTTRDSRKKGAKEAEASKEKGKEGGEGAAETENGTNEDAVNGAQDNEGPKRKAKTKPLYTKLVLAYRQRYLERWNKSETLDQFNELEIEPADWEKVEEWMKSPFKNLH